MNLRRVITVVGVALVALVTSASVQAGYYTAVANGDSIRLTSAALGNGKGPAGEFIATINGSSSNVFRTFCVEKNEFITTDRTYTVGSATAGRVGLDFQSDNSVKASVISTGLGTKSIIDGSVNTANPSANKLTWGAALLYREFALGLFLNSAVKSVLGIESYTFTNGAQRDADATDMQNAIWYYQSQIALTAAQAAANKYIAAVESYLANTGYTTGRVAGVQILNIVNTAPNPDENKQSQLYWNGTGTLTDVPEPTALALWGAAAACGVFVRRRNARKAEC